MQMGLFDKRYTTMKFPFNWSLKEAIFTKDKGKVFSCFACGGGSSMGYKLAGYDVIGCNEIDPKLVDLYKANLNPKFAFVEGIQTFKLRSDLPDELYNLDILDGSPPCSTFSIAGSREKAWGVEKKFREGQVKQVLDTLFFDFIDLAFELRPKIVIAENVKGILMGKAKAYTEKIHKEFALAGYHSRHFLLDASKMGVPQRRERVFFIALRDDFDKALLDNLDLSFNEPIIPYSAIRRDEGTGDVSPQPSTIALWGMCDAGRSLATVHPKGYFFNNYRLSKDKVVFTITGNHKNLMDSDVCRALFKEELLAAGSFPTDYDFGTQKPNYVIGMSVPPVMMANVADEIYKQIISKLC